MPIPIRYTTTNVSNSVRLGNIALGINAVDYGPSTTSGWAAGVSIPSDGYDGEYAIYYLSGTNLRIRKADTFTLTTVAGQIMGTTYASNAAALSGLAAAGYAVTSTVVPPNTVTSGSVFYVNAGLVMSYPRTNSVWYDISGNANNGTLTNGPTFNVSGGIVFDGINDYIQTSYNTQLNDFTICALFRNNSSTGYARIADKNYSSGFWLGQNGVTANQWGGGVRQISGFNFITLSNSAWHFIAMTRTGTTLTVYGDGITNTNTTTCGAGALDTTILSLGATINDGAAQRDWFTGNISNVQIYNRVLSTSEILQNYYQGNIVTSSLVMALDAGNLVSYPGSGTAWTTLTGSNSGTLVNGPTFSSANGGVIVFDGVDDTATTTLTNTGTNNTTQIVWYKWNGINQIKVISYLGDGGSNGLGFLIHDGSGGTAGNKVGVLYGGVAFNALSGGASATLTSGVWCQLAITRDNTTTSLYQNGTLIGTTTASPAGNASSLAFTANFGAGGSISSVLFYTKSLSASEVVQNFNAYKNRFNL
jgi:hypothetical protein